MPQPDQTAIEAALFHEVGDTGFRDRSLATLEPGAETWIVSEDPGFASGIAATRRLGFGALGLDVMPLDEPTAIEVVQTALAEVVGAPLLIVDMSWTRAHVIGPQAIEAWARVTEYLSEEAGVRIVSVYSREQMIELHILAAFRAHRQFLAPSGLYENPHWLPSRLTERTTVDQQLAFLLGRAVPDYAGAGFFSSDDRMFARGTGTDWIAAPKTINPLRQTGPRWHIYCFGQLRVHIEGGQRVDWRIPGSSPRKTKTLFAFLLQRGETGAHADELGELLWSGDGDEETKRGRLHHTVTMLRKALSTREAVLRAGDYYRLSVPPGSWTDITSFEQLCRRGLSLAKSGRSEAALEQYRTAEELYLGDLFADLPADVIHDTGEDWVLPKRTWLREMAIKLQRDMSILLRSDGKLREAMEHCQKALSLDPTSEDANMETLRVLHAQGRLDAMARLFRQYKAALADAGGIADYHEVQALYRALASTSLPPEPEAKEKPKRAE